MKAVYQIALVLLMRLREHLKPTYLSKQDFVLNVIYSPFLNASLFLAFSVCVVNNPTRLLS